MSGSVKVRVRHYKDDALIKDEEQDIPTNPREITSDKFGPPGGAWPDGSRPDYLIINHPGFPGPLRFDMSSDTPSIRMIINLAEEPGHP